MINWIDDNIGTSFYDYAKDIEGVSLIDVRDMVDKAGNEISLVKEKIDKAVSIVKGGGKAVICCDYGISRSNGIAIGVYSKLHNIDFYEAVRHVIEKIGSKEIKPEILTAVYKALGSKESLEVGGNNILITGASGFIGSKLSPLLDKDAVVYTPSRQEVDLMNPLALDIYVKKHKISYIVHLANPRIYNTVSAMGDSLVILKNVLTACTVNDVHLLHVSSWEVYSGYETKFLSAAENLPVFPKGMYSETKMLCENLIKAVSGNSLKCTIVRFSPIYGIGSDKPKFIYNFIDKLSSGSNVSVHRYQNGHPCLDLLYIDDAVDILAKIIKSRMCGEFNVGSGVLTSTTEIAQIIANCSGVSLELTVRDIATNWANIAMDNSKTKEVFGWTPSINITEGVNKIVKGLI